DSHRLVQASRLRCVRRQRLFDLRQPDQFESGTGHKRLDQHLDGGNERNRGDGQPCCLRCTEWRKRFTQFGVRHCRHQRDAERERRQRSGWRLHADGNGYRGVSDPHDHGAAHRDGAEPELHDLGEPEQCESGAGRKWLEHHFDDGGRKWWDDQPERVRYSERGQRRRLSYAPQFRQQRDAERERRQRSGWRLHADGNGYRGVSDPYDHGAAHRDGAEPELHDLGEPEQFESGAGREWLEHHFDDGGRKWRDDQPERVRYSERGQRLRDSDVCHSRHQRDAERERRQRSGWRLHADGNGYRGVSDPHDHGAAHRDGAEPELHDLGEPEQCESGAGRKWLEHHFDDGGRKWWDDQPERVRYSERGQRLRDSDVCHSRHQRDAERERRQRSGWRLHGDGNGHRGVSDPHDHGAAHRDGAEPELHDLGEPEQCESGAGREWLEHHFDDGGWKWRDDQPERVRYSERGQRLRHSDVRQCRQQRDAERECRQCSGWRLHADYNGYRGVSDPYDHGAAHRDGAEPQLHDLGEPEQYESGAGRKWLEHHFDLGGRKWWDDQPERVRYSERGQRLRHSDVRQCRQQRDAERERRQRSGWRLHADGNGYRGVSDPHDHGAAHRDGAEQVDDHFGGRRRLFRRRRRRPFVIANYGDGAPPSKAPGVRRSSVTAAGYEALGANPWARGRLRGALVAPPGSSPGP